MWSILACPCGTARSWRTEPASPTAALEELAHAFFGVASHAPAGRGGTGPGEQRHERAPGRPETAAAALRVAASTPFEFGVGGGARMPELDAPRGCGVVDHGPLVGERSRPVGSCHCWPGDRRASEGDEGAACRRGGGLRLADGVRTPQWGTGFAGVSPRRLAMPRRRRARRPRRRHCRPSRPSRGRRATATCSAARWWCHWTTQHPSGPTIPIAVARHPAEDPAARIGSLVIDPGGPGVSGIDDMANELASLTPLLLDDFDIVHVRPSRRGAQRPGDLRGDVRRPDRPVGSRARRHRASRLRPSRGSSSSQLPASRRAPTCSRTSGRSTPPATSSSSAARSATPASPIWGSPTARCSDSPTPRSSPPMCGPWCSTASSTPR